MDAVMVQGQGTTENLRVAGKLPGPGSSLRFKITEALLKDCTESEYPSQVQISTFAFNGKSFQIKEQYLCMCTWIYW